MQIWLFGLLQIIPFAYSQCTTRQYDDGAGGCLDCLTQCATCTTGTTCDTCTLRYYQSGSDCLICDPSCKECSGTSSYCTNCDTSQNLYLDQVTNTCIACDSPKYKDGINCVDTCPVYINLADFTCVALCDSNCLTCAIYSNSCTTCDASNYLDLTSNQCVTACDINCSTCLTTTTNCQSCSTGMYLDNITTASGTCKQCNSPCSVCQSPSDVEVCTDCQSTYYLDGASTCQLCDPTCYECTGSLSTECSQCVLGKYLITNGSDKSCESCVAPCDNCSSDTICDSCVSQYYLNGTACDPCTSPCFTCETTDTHCLTCAPGDNRVLINNQCICDQNFFDQNNGDYVCPPCDANCKTCVDSATKCTSCYDKFYLDSNVCQPCHWNCLTCVTTATNCLSCDEVVNLRIFYNNQCLCVNGQYYSDSQQICAQCVDPCQYCLSGKDSNGVDYNGTQCSSCQAIYNRIISGTICVCKSGYFDAGFLACQPCASYCISCLTSETDCDVCKPNTFRDSTKKCQCLDGYFGTSTVCQPCTSPCLNCEISNTHCLSCITGVNRVLSSNACICAPGYYETTTSPKVCQPCTPPCATCKYFPDKCFSCIAKYYQPSGQLTCLPCDVPCEECAPNDGTKCKTCLAVQNREVLNQVCVCKIDYYQLDNVTPCSQCIAPCYECEDNGDGTQCVSCKAGDNRTVDTNKQCICSSNYYSQLSSLVCKACISPCLECLDDALALPADGTQCVTCQPGLNRIIDNINNKCNCLDGYYETTGVLACTQCSPPCYDCADNGTGAECTTCPPGTFRIVDLQVCICQDGYYQVGTNLICSPCNYTCQKCYNLPSECHLCDPLKHRTAVGNTCICQDNYYDNMTNDQDCKPCTSPCEQCHTNTNGTKCKTCLPGLNRHYSNYLCICDDGYFELNATCVKCHSTCVTCSNSYSCLSCNTTQYDQVTFRNGLACVCKQGFEMNQSGQCVQQCPMDCLTCNVNTCLTCNSNRVLLNGRCVCALPDNTRFCRASCSDINFGKLAASLTSPSSNILLSKLNSNSLSPSTIVMDTIIDSSISCSLISSLQQGIISTDKNNYNSLLFKPQEIQIDQSPFGNQASYFNFVKDNVRYLLFQKDATTLNLRMQYQFATVANNENIQINAVPKSSLNQQIITFNVDSTDTVVLVFTYNINDPPTITSSIINKIYQLNIQLSSSQPVILLTEFYVSSATFSAATNAQLITVANYIGQLYWQGIAFECTPHPKNTKQIFWENHQFLLEVIPTNLLPLKVTDGSNYISTALSSSKFTGNSALIQLNNVDINYQTTSIQYDSSGFSYFTVQFPEILVFGLHMLSQFIFSQFTIQHFITTGYQINTQQLTYTSNNYQFVGYMVDIYGTTSVKTLIFGFNQGHTFNVVQNANNVLITVSGANVKQINFAVMAFDDTLINNSYQTIFEQYIQLLIKSIELSTRTPLRFVNQYWKLNPISITGTFEALTEQIGGYFINIGTNAINTKFPFDISHKISTNLKQNIIYTNGYLVNGDSAFGKLTKYFTQANEKFVLGAQLNNIQYISISMASTDTFVSCSQSETLYKDIYAYVSLCKRTETQVYQIFIINLNEYDGSIVLSQTSTEVKISNIQKIRQLYYLMVLSRSSNNLNTYAIIQNIYPGIFKSIGYFGFDFQCLTYNSDLQCDIFRNGYQSSMNNEFDTAQNLVTDVQNMNGKKCNYFNFDNAVTVLKNFQLPLDALLNALVQNNYQPMVADNNYQYDALILGKLTSSAQPTIYIDVLFDKNFGLFFQQTHKTLSILDSFKPFSNLIDTFQIYQLILKIPF